jgi:hypothetical protein
MSVINFILRSISVCISVSAGSSFSAYDLFASQWCRLQYKITDVVDRSSRKDFLAMPKTYPFTCNKLETVLKQRIRSSVWNVSGIWFLDVYA